MESLNSTNSPQPASRFFSLIILLLAALYATLLFLSVANENQTNDESAHIAAGYSYWRTGDFRLNPEHPPLSKLLCTIPLLVLRPAFPDNPTAWSEADQFGLGRQLLYSSPDQAQRILLACRSMTILFTAFFIASVAFWTRRYIGTGAALIVFLLLLFDPNIAAHGRYVTSDIFVSAFFFFTCAFWYLWLRHNRNMHLWLAAVALALALASKFNAVLLIPVLFLMWALRRWRNPKAPSLRRAVVPLIILPAAILFTLYAGDTRSVANDPLISERFEARGQSPAAWQRIPVPGYYWFRGLQLLYRHQHQGHPTYLLGKLSDSGFLAYFPVAFLVKTATGTLLLVLAAVILLFFSIRRSSQLRFSLPLAFSIPITLYFVVAMLSRIDIGVRHILLIYPFIYLLIADAASKFPNQKFIRVLIPAALLINLGEFAYIYPHPTAFFNTFAGGPNAGPRYLTDSNLDWGQGLIHLQRALTSTPHSCVALSYFGRAETEYYIPGAKPVPLSLAGAKNQPCLIAVSVEQLYNDPLHRLSYLLAHQPIARPSYSIYLYDPSRF